MIEKHKTSLDSNAYTDSGISIPSEPSQANFEPHFPLQSSSEFVTSVWSSKYSNQKGSRPTTSSETLHAPNQSGDGSCENETPQRSLSRANSGISSILAMEETQYNVTGYAPVLNSMTRLLPADIQDSTAGQR